MKDALIRNIFILASEFYHLKLCCIGVVVNSVSRVLVLDELLEMELWAQKVFVIVNRGVSDTSHKQRIRAATFYIH